MRYIRTLSVILFLIFLSTTSFAADTRGLQVVAKDAASGKQGIVKLYNKSYAVIIGIDKYPNLPPGHQLFNAVKDAKGIEEVLRKNYQFDKIIVLQNEQATKDRILELLTEELPGQMGKEDALFLFWAGHGNQEKSDYGEIGYLIPYDGAMDKIRKNLTMAEIRDTISKKIPAKHVFYVMDACYSGLLTTRAVGGKTRRDLSYLREITKESARQVLTAGGKGEEALDGGPKGHSVFTGRLIEILESASDFITANELQASIREKVFSDASARNHKQTPGYGALYGLGDFVFIPKEKDRLGDLAGASAARQKELEQLKQAEREAAEAKKREQAEISRKEKELAVLDKQISDMKGRLGSGIVRTGDSIDQIMAMAEQKEEQGKRLEELRRQREAEEEKRRQEIERLKLEAKRNRILQIDADLAKYEKVASSKYAQDMKGAAWAAVTSGYPEAKNVKTGDVDGFLRVLGLTRDGPELVTFEEKEKRAIAKLARLTYTDSSTGLMWARHDSGRDIIWQDAKRYCENYRAGGFTDWRVPTYDELTGLFASGNLKDKIKSTKWVCVSDTRGSQGGYFSLNSGNKVWNPQTASCYVLPVRNAK